MYNSAFESSNQMPSISNDSSWTLMEDSGRVFSLACHISITSLRKYSIHFKLCFVSSPDVIDSGCLVHETGAARKCRCGILPKLHNPNAMHKAKRTPRQIL